MSPLVYLTLRSLWNRTRIRVKRLREPRYLVGALFGLAYLWLFFLRPRPGLPAGVISSPSATALELGGAAFVFLITSMAWVWPGRAPALSFSQADVHFLFTAPFTRRELIRYKVIRLQIASFMGSAFLTILLRPMRNWMFFVGLALTMIIINLHNIGVSLSRESIGKHGLTGLARQWVPVVAVIGAAIILIGTVVGDWGALSSMSGSAIVTELERIGSTGAAGIVLWPFRAVTRLPLAATPAAFLTALPAALLILILNYFWVIRSDAKFEEASAELAERIARIVKGKQPVRTRKAGSRRAPPFDLSMEGRPETAIFWKNLILLGRFAWLRTPAFILIAGLGVGVLSGMFGVAAARGPGGMASTLSALFPAFFVLTLVFGPQFARNDLRQDLGNLTVLKTWPIRGAQLVRGEVLAPTVLLTGITWFCALGTFFFAAPLRMQAAWAVSAALLAPGILLLQLLVQNLVAILWPSWTQVSTPRARGIDVMGQRMIATLGMLLVLAVALLPAAIAGGAAGLALYGLTGRISIILPAAIAAFALLLEAYAASEAIGKLMDRTDVSALDAEE